MSEQANVQRSAAQRSSERGARHGSFLLLAGRKPAGVAQYPLSFFLNQASKHASKRLL